MASSKLPFSALSAMAMHGRNAQYIPSYPKLSQLLGLCHLRLESPSPFRIMRLVTSIKSAVPCFFLYAEHCLGRPKKPGPLNTTWKLEIMLCYTVRDPLFGKLDF